MFCGLHTLQIQDLNLVPALMWPKVRMMINEVATQTVKFKGRG